MRDIYKQEKQGMEFIRKHQRLALTVGEVMQFKDEFWKTENISEGLFNVIGTAFYMGVAVGSRNKK